MPSPPRFRYDQSTIDFTEIFVGLNEVREVFLALVFSSCKAVSFT